MPFFVRFIFLICEGVKIISFSLKLSLNNTRCFTVNILNSGDKLKIAWFTPLSNRTGIAAFSKALFHELSNHFEKVDIWAYKNQKQYIDEKEFPNVNFVFFDDNVKEKDLVEYDVLIYNLGNNSEFHMEITNLAKKFKGIQIMHDFVMLHFFWYCYHQEYLKKRDNKYKKKIKFKKFLLDTSFAPLFKFGIKILKYFLGYINSLFIGRSLVVHQYFKEYYKDVEKIYGRKVFKMQKKYLDKYSTEKYLESDLIFNYPFFEKTVNWGKGIVVHSNFYEKRIKEYSKIPSVKLNFPPPIITKFKEVPIKKTPDKLLFLSFGHIVPNKRITEVIKVIGQNKYDIADKIEYVIIGKCCPQYYQVLQNLVEEYHIENIVKFLGYQDNNVLFSYLKHADIIINLRYPNAEGASWSLVEQMLFEKTIITSKSGFYAEIPDDCTVKIETKNEKLELKNALIDLINNDEKRIKLGKTAKEFALKTFNTKKYCIELAKFVKEVYKK